jgi:hypothetical protein
MKRTIAPFCAFLILIFVCGAKAAPAIADIDRVRIAEVFRLGEKLQTKLWKGWEKAPFSLLFVTDDYEFLIRHPKPSDEFRSIGYDKLLKSEVFWRPRQFQKDLLATFPAFTATPVIVVGKAENTANRNSTSWVFVVMHEHFHQLQYSDPTYSAAVAGLNLARGDKGGMWQLNFPFPYKKPDVAASFKQLCNKLLDTYDRRNDVDAGERLKSYLSTRNAFAAMLNADDYRYASFQLWQEGVARYTQYRMAEIAAKEGKPSKAFRSLPDFVPFRKEADRLLASTLKELKTLDLVEWERTVFYPFGAVESLLLDRVNPKWRGYYFTDKFALENFYLPGDKK